jgi:hypothetical protein
MASPPSIPVGVVVVLVVAFAAGACFAFRMDGSGAEYGDLSFLRPT